MRGIPLNGDIAEMISASENSDFVSKFVDVSQHVGSWTEDIGFLAGKRLLDYGCGEGFTSSGLAIFPGPEIVIGVDVVDPGLGLSKVLSSIPEIGNLPANLQFRK